MDTCIHTLPKLVEVHTNGTSFIEGLRITEIICNVHVQITQFLRVIGFRFVQFFKPIPLLLVLLYKVSLFQFVFRLRALAETLNIKRISELPYVRANRIINLLIDRLFYRFISRLSEQFGCKISACCAKVQIFRFSNRTHLF